MHGLVFVTWEKFLNERFGQQLLYDYRAAIGETPANGPIITRVYSDEVLLAGVSAAHQLTNMPVDMLLREYGRYFITNGLTSHLCAYLLTQVYSGRDLLLMMRKAHAQMRNLPEGLTPPLFEYVAHPTDPSKLMLIYNSSRKLCALLLGAIEGAAQRFGDHVEIVERTCMHQGADACRFEIHFTPSISRTSQATETAEQERRRRTKQQLAENVLLVLPDNEANGLKLVDIHAMLQRNLGQLRLNILLEAIHHLQYAGLVASTASRPDDNLTNRRYWRVEIVRE